MGNIHFEVSKALIEYCAPVLLKKKPAALFTLPTSDCLICLKNTLKNVLSTKIMCKYQNSSLVIVYDRALMEMSLLKNEEIGRALSLFGYQDCFSVENYLIRLKERFEASGGFPHEIGLFLGYPVEDVFGFIRNKGQEYKYCGIWKVYGDEEYSRKCFEEYKYCGQCLKEHFLKGGTAQDFSIIYGMNTKKKTEGGNYYE